MMFLLITMFLTQAIPAAGLGGVLVTKTVGENIQITCTPPNDTTYYLERELSNKTITIAECVSDKCFLKDDTLKKLYDIRHTDDGAVLKLLTVDQNTYGIYQCCETYKPDICDSKVVSEQDKPTTQNNDMKTEPPFEQVYLIKSSVSKQEGVVQIQCISSLDVTFEFVNGMIKIAECMPSGKHCIIFDNPFGETYSISYRKHGGILTINHANKDAHGTYRCFSTKNTSNSQSVTLGPQDATLETTTNIYNVVGKEDVNVKGQQPIFDDRIGGILAVSVISCVLNFVILLCLHFIRKKTY